MKRRIYFRNKDAPEAGMLRAWHTDLLGQPSRGDRARLRRAGTIEEAAMAPAFHALLRRLGLAATGDSGEAASPCRLSELAALAALASAVKTDTPGVPLGRTLGRAREGSSSPTVSEARFRRLLESEELDQRFEDLRRIVAVASSSVDLSEIAGAVCDWTAARRRRLAYDYYAIAPSKSKETT